MNKIGLCSGILSVILTFLQSIPVGISFSAGISSYATISLALFSFNNLEYHIWGSLNPSSLESILWLELNIFPFIFVYIFTMVAGIITIIGSAIARPLGKNIMRINAALLIVVICFISFYLPLNSIEIFGTHMEVLTLFSSLGNGYIALIINFILAIIANKYHEVESE